MPVLAANLLDAESGKPVFPAMRVVKAGHLQIGLVGLVEDKPFSVAKVEGVKVGPPAPAAREAVAAAQAAGADLVFLVTHASLGALKKLLPEVSGVHLAFAGQERRLPPRPERVGETLLLGGGDRGRRIGHLELVLHGAPWRLANAGEAEALRQDLEGLERRIGRYRRTLEEQDRPGSEKRRQMAEQRLPKLEDELVEKMAAFERAQKAPVSGNRFALALGALSSDVPDHPGAAKRVAEWRRKGGGSKKGKGHRGPMPAGIRRITPRLERLTAGAPVLPAGASGTKPPVVVKPPAVRSSGSAAAPGPQPPTPR